MKQHLTEINGRRLLFVELPEKAQNIVINLIGDCLSYYNPLDPNNSPIEFVNIPEGNWQLYGSPYSLSEEQAKELVPRYKILNGGEYRDYVGRPDILLKTALESWQSFLEREKVYKDNPYGEKPKRRVPFMGPGQYTQNDLDEIEEFQNELKIWQEAEQRVFRNAVLLVEEKR